MFLFLVSPIRNFLGESRLKTPNPAGLTPLLVRAHLLSSLPAHYEPLFAIIVGLCHDQFRSSFPQLISVIIPYP